MTTKDHNKTPTGSGKAGFGGQTILDKGGVKKVGVAKLASSGLSEANGSELGITFQTGPESAALKVWKNSEHAAVVIPYVSPWGDDWDFARYRCLTDPPPVILNKKGKNVFPKYKQLNGTPVHAYFPTISGVDWAAYLADPEKPLVMTEGELKAACATVRGFPTIGLGGVDSFQAGEAVPFLPELEKISWTGRKVYICYDTDATANARVSGAEERLAKRLRERGAIPYRVVLPKLDGKKTGLDDFLIHKGGGAAEFQKLLDAAEEIVFVVLTEHTLSLEFMARHLEGLRYCHNTGAWFVWTGKAWRKDETRKVFAMIRRVCSELAATEDDKTRIRVECAKVMAAVEKIVQADEIIAVSASIWNTQPFLLGTPDGTVDLRTGELTEPNPEDYITALTAVAPAAKANCPIWLKFLDDTTGSDKKMIRYLQQWAGYGLTGDVSEQQLAFHFGDGGNGKGVYMNTLFAIMKDYATAAGIETFTMTKNPPHPTDLAKLAGKRFVTVTETEAGHYWAEQRLKMVTGGDPISARFMNKDFFDYMPQFKLMVVGNHKPKLTNLDDAAKRRFNMLPFVLKPAEPDPTLTARLRAEWPAILRWMIDGCLDWQKHGLVRPEVVTEATKEYFEAQDTMGAWIAENCVTAKDAKGKPPTDKPSALLADFLVWAEANGEKRLNRTTFKEAIERRAGITYKKIRGDNVVEGIRKKTPAEHSANADR